MDWNSYIRKYDGEEVKVAKVEHSGRVMILGNAIYLLEGCYVIDDGENVYLEDPSTFMKEYEFA